MPTQKNFYKSVEKIDFVESPLQRTESKHNKIQTLENVI